MAIPVLIPARNEAEHIANALHRLPADSTEPIVLANGCTDNTIEIARGFGVTVLERTDESKVFALQDGIRFLGHRATSPFITLDADSFPIFPNRWAKSMATGLNHTGNRPSVIAGPFAFIGSPGLVANVVATVKRYQTQRKTRNDDFLGYFAGRNMLIHPARQSVVDSLLELNNLWPGEDYAIRDLIVEAGGGTYKVTSALAAVATDGTRNPTLRQLLFEDTQETRKRLKYSYIEDRPNGAKRYFRPTNPAYTMVDDTDLPYTGST